MVYSVNNNKATAFQSAIAGGLAGAVTRAIAQPFDVIKIRFQLQIEPIQYRKESKYKSVLQAVRAIVKEEGVGTLWSGHIPAQILSITYGVFQFSTYEELTRLCKNADSTFYNDHKHSLNFCNGAIAATIATVTSFPFDTVRTRLIAEQKTIRAYKGFLNAFSTIVKTEGPTALYKGLVPTLGQIAPYAGIQFVVYKFCTENFLSRFQVFQRSQGDISTAVETSLAANLIAGSVAGIISKTAVYPFDLIKKRLQIQGFQEHRKYFGKQIYCNGSMECIKLTLTDEGFLALYKGFLPSMLKAVLVSALHFAVYDEIKHFFTKN